MEEQSQRRHDVEEVEQRASEAQHPYRPPKQRIKQSLKARGAGYPLIAFLLICSWLTGHFLDPRDFFFIERDPALSYPYKSDTVPSWTLAFIGAFGPVFFIVLTQVLIRRSPRSKYFDKRTKDIHLVLIVLGEVLSVTWLITNILKCYVGRLRPNFFAYCDYKGYREAVNQRNFTSYFAQTTPGEPGDFRFCLRPNSDAHFSFPSGHASISFCGLGFLTLFLLHVTARINFTHHSLGKVIRFFIVLVPLFSAALVASTRVIDYKHNVEDTIWGALIGLLGAFLAFHANYGYKRPVKQGVPVLFGDLQTDHPHPFAPPTPPNPHQMPPNTAYTPNMPPGGYPNMSPTAYNPNLPPNTPNLPPNNTYNPANLPGTPNLPPNPTSKQSPGYPNV